VNKITIFKGVFPLGLGTNRFPIASATDEAGIELSAQMVVDALNGGVYFIDATHTYSRGKAQEVLRRAFQQTSHPYGVTIKTRLDIDRRADEVRRRADETLKNLGIARAKYLYFWSLFSYDEYVALMPPGGAYEGALRLKDEGIIDHICFSTHAPIPDIVKIMRSGAFEAVTISYSLLTAKRFAEVLQVAHELDIGVAAMNPLGGGIIPRNEDYFGFAKCEGDSGVAEAALRFALANVDIALSGVSSRSELRQNLQAVTVPSAVSDEERVIRVNSGIAALKDFCTGCGYCAGCPAEIPISAIMQCRNSLQLNNADSSYAFVSDYVRENIYVCSKLEQDFSWLPETTDNPCLGCGECERKCTQRLNIIEAVADTYKRAEYSGFSRQHRIRQLLKIIDNSPDHTIGVYPSGITSMVIVRFYRENISELKCNMVLFDSNPAVWGTVDSGFTVYPPGDIATIKPSTVIITSYKFKNEIYEDIKQYEADGVKIVKLSGDNELPWLL
jgi:predicted aldo/keto reductase-like oxidoreductase